MLLQHDFLFLNCFLISFFIASSKLNKVLNLLNMFFLNII
jgi:hypothetical protein